MMPSYSSLRAKQRGQKAVWVTREIVGNTTWRRGQGRVRAGFVAGYDDDDMRVSGNETRLMLRRFTFKLSHTRQHQFSSI